MIARNRLQLALLLSSTVVGLAAAACGGISDPTKGGAADGRVATVSGALTGITVPANARVALVYRKVTATGPGSASTSTMVVGNDVAVVDGKFTMNLGVPADDLFGSVDSSISNVSSPPSVQQAPTASVSPPSAGTSGGTSTSGSPGGFGAGLAPRDIVGGSITEPLTGAMAGFVVYADTNGNGALDLEGQYASSPDQILGGNKELILVYLKGGGSLDYEKMRDKSGILPTAGFDLAWSQGRWLPLTDVELQLSANAQLPSSVCSSSYSSTDTVSDSSGTAGSGSSGTSGGSSGISPSGGPSGSGTSGSSSGNSSGYPSPSDPALHCSGDGRSYTYDVGLPTTCPPSPPPPTGLCAGDISFGSACAGTTGYGNALPAGAPIPDGWPCPTAVTSFDGGAADAGVNTGSLDSGVIISNDGGI
jgi:hypothetical protein